MKSQRLIIDTIKNWSQDRHRGKADIIQHEVDYANLWLVTYEPEYYGAPDFEVVVLWANASGLDEHPDWHGQLHQLVRSFAYQLSLKSVAVKHHGLTTYCSFKSTDETKICDNFDWVDVVAPKPDVI